MDFVILSYLGRLIATCNSQTYHSYKSHTSPTADHIDIQHLNIQTLYLSRNIELYARYRKREMADEHRINIELSVLDVSDDQLLGAFKVEKEEKKRREKVPSMIKIQRVPEIMLRNEDFRECYKPMELSIGPIHASDPNLYKMELKIRLAAEFVKDTGYTEELLLLRIKENIQDLKKSFNEEVINSYSDECLARLLFLDGCATLQFIFSFLDESLNKFGINNGQANLIQQDLFLLENQIPFQVLELLVKFSQVSEHLRAHLVRFVLMNNVLAMEDTAVSHLEPSHNPDRLWMYNPVHLLDLLRLVLSSTDDNVQMQDSVCDNICDNCLEYSCCCCCCLLVCDELILFALAASLASLYRVREHSFRNVQELKAAGIKLKPSDSCSLRSVSFHTRFCFRGHIKLPPFVVDGSTTRKLLNLLAYEMCHPDYETDGIVASYISLLDLLIDNEDDVKDLRAADIIRNRLSSDTEVAKLFNSLGSICIAPPRDSYKYVKRDIEKHYKRKFVIWMAQVYRVHFSSPWTILALLAAITILVLTATQTYYAIHPKN